MKKPLLLAIIFYVLSFLTVIGMIILVVYTSKTSWLLAAFMIIICLLLLFSLIWYAIKFTSEYHSYLRKDDHFVHFAVPTPLGKLADQYLLSIYPKSSYKVIQGYEGDYTYRIYAKLNEASPEANLMIIEGKQIKDLISFSNGVHKVLMIHDLPAGQSKTLVVLVLNKSDKNSSVLYHLNGSKNASDGLYFALFEKRMKMVCYGEDKGIASSAHITYMHSVMSRLFAFAKGK